MIKYCYGGDGYRKRLENPAAYPASSKEFLYGLYRSMLRIRMVEEAIEAVYHENEIKTPIHLVVGQEATAVGLCAALRREDHLYCSHRTHGGYLAKGGDLKAMMCEMYCRANGCVGSRGGSMHLIDKKAGLAGTSAIVGGIVPIATGAALAMQMQNKDTVSAVLFGEAANEEGVMSESLNFAVLKKLPVIFFCENNFYSVQSPLDKRQPITKMHERAAGFGIATEYVDGSNVLDVYEATQRAVERARSGGGPTYIEAPVYRWRAHAGAGDDSQTGYRDEAEREHWQTQACPVALLRDYMTKLKVFDDGDAARMEAELKKEIDEAFAYAIASPNPTEADLGKHVYAMG